ncbi:hypothetical protein HerbRD11066_36110 [Herbidospora sp. RD11066]
MFEGEPQPPVLSVIFGHQVNTGQIGGDQTVFGSPSGRIGGGSSGCELPAASLLEAAEGFITPSWMTRARKRSSDGIVLLAGGAGTGRWTAALNLLSGLYGSAGVIRHLRDDLDFGAWGPAKGEAYGYVVEGSLGGLVENHAALTALRSRLLKAGAVMVVILPDEPEMAARLDTFSGLSPIRCTPPDAERVFHAKLALAVPDQQQRLRLLAELPGDLLPDLLPLGASPSDALDVVEAVVKAGSATDIRAGLWAVADSEIAERLMCWLRDPKTCGLLISAAVFEGSRLGTIMDQADRLASTIAGSFAGEDALARHEQSSVRLLRPLGIRSDLVQRPGRQPEYRVFFSRTQWPEAILRHVWRGPLADAVALWLRGTVDDDLVEQAARALALSASCKGGSGRLSRVRACAMSGGVTERALAASALRVLLKDEHSWREIAGQLGGWAQSPDWRLRCVVAITAGFNADTTPPGVALPMLRRLVRAAENEPHPAVDRAVDHALLALFLHSDRHVLLHSLLDWTEYGGAEAAWATRIFPKLLRCDLSWFATTTSDEDTFRLVILLFKRTLRARGPAGPLYDAVLTWQRVASWNADHASTVDAILQALSTDPHPHVRRFLNAVNRTPEEDS